MIDVPDWLHDALVERERERAAERTEALGRFTDREQRLIREAAVMGFVRGTFCPVGQCAIPRDRHIVADVIAGALSHPDHYPLLATGAWEGPAFPPVADPTTPPDVSTSGDEDSS